MQSHSQTAVAASPLPSTQAIVESVRRDGFALVENVFTDSECRNLCNLLESTLADLVRNEKYFGSSRTQVIYNYFINGAAFYPLFAHPLMNEVMTALIDKDYVLISPSARNPRIRDDIPTGKITSGEGWHVDSRVCDPATGALYRPSLSYYSVVALEPFRRENSATHFVRGSHMRYQRPPDRNADMDFEVWEAPAGSVLFFDSAIWHRTGAPTPASRWSIFNMYGPWFMKPYFRFGDLVGRDQLMQMPPDVRRLLHLHSTPPRDSSGRIGTLTKEPAFD